MPKDFLKKKRIEYLFMVYDLTTRTNETIIFMRETVAPMAPPLRGWSNFFSIFFI